MRYRSLPLIFLVVYFSVSCGHKKDSPAPSLVDSALNTTAAVYLNHQGEVQDKDGFIETDACDSLTYSGLLGAATGVTLNIRAAREADGRWHRRPLTYKECFPAGSASTISQDGIIAMLWYAYVHKDLELVQNFYDYAKPRSWIIGDGPRNLTFVGELEPTVAQLLFKLGGADHIARKIPLVWPPGLAGPAAHISMLHLLLRNRLYGTIEESGKKFIKDQVARQPKNPLFQCAAGNVQAATDVLNHANYWPTDRLPTTIERCDNWLPQRDFGADWLPCSDRPVKRHSGGDLLFISTVIAKGWCG